MSSGIKSRVAVSAVVAIVLAIGLSFSALNIARLSPSSTSAPMSPTNMTGLGQLLPRLPERVLRNVTIGASASSTSSDTGLELTISLPKTNYKLRELVNITLTVTNRGTADVYVTVGIMQTFDVLIYDQNGKRIGVWSDGRVPILAPSGIMTLKPGQSISEVLNWDMTVYNVESSTRSQVDPGTYGLQGVFKGTANLGSPGPLPTTPEIRPPLPRYSLVTPPLIIGITS